MNCKNCGTPLMGMEHACPVCGAPLPTQQPNPGVQVVDPAMMAAATMPQQMASQPPQMMPGGTPPMGTPLEEPQPEPKKGNNIFGILLLIVAFAAIGVGVYLALTEEEEAPPKKDTTPSQEETTPSEPSVNFMDYAGYSFIIPSGYSGEISSTYGLMIKGADKIYTISVDYSNTYDYYKQEFTRVFADRTTTSNVGDGNEYTLTRIGEAGSAAGEYMTKAEEGSTFAGLIVKSDFSEVTSGDIGDLYDILYTANKVSEVTPGDEQDAGRTEIVNYMNRFNKDEFIF